jgi:uncharacterized membrane protein YphA (DoxX/SURF4 family)
MKLHDILWSRRKRSPEAIMKCTNNHVPLLPGAAVLHERFDRIDARVTTWMAANAIPLLRVALGIVFVWFGALKLVPGLSPAEDLVRATVPFLPGELFVPFLGVWEVAIGIGFVTGRALRFTILLLFLQMPGTLSPVFLLTERVFTDFPFGLTRAGQYIVNNLVLITPALVIGATVRGAGIRDSGATDSGSRSRGSGVGESPAWSAELLRAHLS